jgi:hypothetical protein
MVAMNIIHKEILRRFRFWECLLPFGSESCIPIQWCTEGVQTPPPPKKNLKFWQSWAKFPVPWKIHPNNLLRIRVSLICKLGITPDYGATAPRPPFSLPSVLNWICLTPQTKVLCMPLQYTKLFFLPFILDSCTSMFCSHGTLKMLHNLLSNPCPQ